LLEGLLLSTFVGLRLGALDGSPLGSEGGANVLGDPDDVVLGIAVGYLLGSLEGSVEGASLGVV
jgi:hypothetical protein